MFTGIISHQGKIYGFRKSRREMVLEAPDVSPLLNLGGSLAVNGVCLSLTHKERGWMTFNLSDETLQKSTLGSLKTGILVNLELPLTLNQPLDGHLVSGHIDGIARVDQMLRKSSGKRFRIIYPRDLKPLLVTKGSVALDGVSLTIAAAASSSFDVEVIPITLEQTNIDSWRPGTSINIECDMIGKYVYNWSVTKK